MNNNRKDTIIKIFTSMLKENGVNVTEHFFEKDFVLLDSGLDSLGFAILVARLEEELQYDPFIEMETPVYPKTFFEFLNIYEQK